MQAIANSCSPCLSQFAFVSTIVDSCSEAVSWSVQLADRRPGRSALLLKQCNLAGMPLITSLKRLIVFSLRFARGIAPEQVEAGAKDKE